MVTSIVKGYDNINVATLNTSITEVTVKLSRIIGPILILVIVNTTLAGCSTEGSGDPHSQTTTVSDTTKATSASTSTSTRNGSLASYDPCVELKAIAGQFSLTAIEDEGEGDCFARFSPSVGVTVGIILDAPLAEAGKGPNAQVSDITVNERAAKLIRRAASDTACAVAMKVDVDRVDVIASANASLDEACDAAIKIATALEPNLLK